MLNRITIMGRLTHDPELRNTPAGVSVCSFSIACDRDYKQKDKERETDFINCVAWRSSAEFVSRHFTKGRMAVVDGRLQIRDWTDRDGAKRRSAEIVADNVYFADSKPKTREGGDGAEPPAYDPEEDNFGFPPGFVPDLGEPELDNTGNGELPF